MSERQQDPNVSPVKGRPQVVEGYGLRGSDTEHDLTPWSHVEEQMAKSRNYWIGTTRPDGRPHSMPVWGVWLDSTFYFGTERGSIKAKNLDANPALSVHLESGDDAVIFEGIAEEFRDADTLKNVDEAYLIKYNISVIEDPSNPGLFYALRPHTVFAWTESDFINTATRWRFPER